MKQQKGEYRSPLIAAAVKKISSLSELTPTDFILTNHKAEQQRQRVERAKKRISSLPSLGPES